MYLSGPAISLEGQCGLQNMLLSQDGLIFVASLSSVPHIQRDEYCSC